jgi:hypothetical protein
MVARVKEKGLIGKGVGPVRDDRPIVGYLLSALADHRLGERIAEAARLAQAEHQRQSAQEMRSIIEAENSTLQA